MKNTIYHRENEHIFRTEMHQSSGWDRLKWRNVTGRMKESVKMHAHISNLLHFLLYTFQRCSYILRGCICSTWAFRDLQIYLVCMTMANIVKGKMLFIAQDFLPFLSIVGENNFRILFLGCEGHCNYNEHQFFIDNEEICLKLRILRLQNSWEICSFENYFLVINKFSKKMQLSFLTTSLLICYLNT